MTPYECIHAHMHIDVHIYACIHTNKLTFISLANEKTSLGMHHLVVETCHLKIYVFQHFKKTIFHNNISMHIINKKVGK